MPYHPQIVQPKDYIEGLTHSNNGSDANNDIDVAAGYAMSNDADPNDRVLIHLASAITKRLDASWAVGSGNGGLSTGSKASGTWYYTWLWLRPDTGVVDLTFDPSSTSPTSPDAAYTKKAYIGQILTDGSSNILAFRHVKDWWIWGTLPTALSTTSPSTSDPQLTVQSVPGQRCEVELILFANNTSGNVRMSVADGDRANGSDDVRVYTQVANIVATTSGSVVTDTSSRIRYDASLGTGWNQFDILVRRYNDARGRR